MTRQHTAQDTFEALKRTTWNLIDQIDDISFDTTSWPDFYIEYATFEDGTELSEEQMDWLLDHEYDWCYEKAVDIALFHKLGI